MNVHASPIREIGIDKLAYKDSDPPKKKVCIKLAVIIISSTCQSFLFY